MKMTGARQKLLIVEDDLGLQKQLNGHTKISTYFALRTGMKLCHCCVRRAGCGHA